MDRARARKALQAALWIGGAALGALVLVGLSGGPVVVRVAGFTERAKQTKIRNDLMAIIRAAELYQATLGRVPESIEELKAGKDQWGQEIVSASTTRDPWGNNYVYDIDPAGRPRARCLGKDGRVGGDGEDRDYMEVIQ